MLIITADDWGGNRTATDHTMRCFASSRLTSVSAMVFMEDSERAAALGREQGLDAGLHLNLTQPFNGAVASGTLPARQSRIAAFLRRSKWSPLLYHPLLRGDFEYVFRAQYDEFCRLYNRTPTHVDGHHHMHLCANMLVDRLIPPRLPVRRNFSFSSSEKGSLNRLYRYLVDAALARRYTCTDFFFSVSVAPRVSRLEHIVRLAHSRNVELMVHPEREDDLEFLMSDTYFRLISSVRTGSYAALGQAVLGART
jgi:predicted glycoside hydrolase/deacetylase ChbG (UPF0249 family)